MFDVIPYFCGIMSIKKSTITFSEKKPILSVIFKIPSGILFRDWIRIGGISDSFVKSAFETESQILNSNILIR